MAVKKLKPEIARFFIGFRRLKAMKSKFVGLPIDFIWEIFDDISLLLGYGSRCRPYYDMTVELTITFHGQLFSDVWWLSNVCLKLAIQDGSCWDVVSFYVI